MVWGAGALIETRIQSRCPGHAVAAGAARTHSRGQTGRHRTPGCTRRGAPARARSRRLGGQRRERRQSGGRRHAQAHPRHAPALPPQLHTRARTRLTLAVLHAVLGEVQQRLLGGRKCRISSSPGCSPRTTKTPSLCTRTLSPASDTFATQPCWPSGRRLCKSTFSARRSPCTHPRECRKAMPWATSISRRKMLI